VSSVSVAPVDCVLLALVEVLGLELLGEPPLSLVDVDEESEHAINAETTSSVTRTYKRRTARSLARDGWSS
jgi:hypothetical protein